MVRIRFPNLSSFATAFSSALMRRKISPDVPDVELSSLNTQFGLDGATLFDGTSGHIRKVNGQIKIGDMLFDDFNKLSLDAKLEFINTKFNPGSVTKFSDRINSKFVDASKRVRALDEGASGVARAEKGSLKADGTVNTGSKSWTTLMTKLAVVYGGTWTLLYINKLLEGNSGCFLMGPDGEEERLSGDKENCNCSTPNSIYANACCTKCKLNGDTNLICPNESQTDNWTIPYENVCPSISSSAARSLTSRVTRSRSAISASADAAQVQAEAMALALAATAPPRAATATATSALSSSSVCTSCGCSPEAGLWKLCYRDESVFSIIGGLVADVGKKIVEGVDGALDIIDATLGALGDVMRLVGMVVGGAIGVAILVAASILIARVVKKKKERRRNSPLVGGDLARAIKRLGQVKLK